MINKIIMKNIAMFAAATVFITPILSGCNASSESSSDAGASAEVSTSDKAQTSTSTGGSTSTSTEKITSTSKAATTAQTTKTSKVTTTAKTIKTSKATTTTTKVSASSSDTIDESIKIDSTTKKMADEVVRLVNIERKKAGVKALKTAEAGNNAAQLRAVEIEKSFSHNRPDGSSCFTVADEFKINSGALGENIAAGHKTPEKVVAEWMKSPWHKKNILSSSYTHIGVGYYKKSGSEYTYYWTQFFYTK